MSELTGTTSGGSAAVPEGADPRDAYFSREHLKDNLRARSASGGVVTAMAQGARLALRTLSIPVLNRLLTPDDFGVFSVVLSITSLAGMLSFSGLTMSTVQREKITHAQVSSLFWINAGISAGLAVLMLAASPLVGMFYGDARTTLVTAVMSVTILLAGLALQHQAILTRHMRVRAVSGCDLASQLLGIVAALVAAWLGAGYWALVVQSVVTQLLFLLGILWFCRWVPSRPKLAEGTGAMVKFGLDLTWTNLVAMGRSMVDLAVVGRLFGTVVAGLYSRSYAVLQLPVAQFVQPMAGVAIPMLSVLAPEPVRLRSAWRQLQEKLALVTMPPIAGLIATSDWSIRILLGPQWSESAAIFAVLGFLGMVQPVLVAHHWLFIAGGKTRQLLIANIVLLVMVVIGALSVLNHGAIGVAWGMVISTVVLQVPFQFWFTARCTPVRVSDLIMSIVPALSYSAAVLVGAYGVRRFVSFDALTIASSVKGLCAAGLGSAVCCGLLYLCVPMLRAPVRQAVELGLSPLLRRIGPRLREST